MILDLKWTRSQSRDLWVAWGEAPSCWNHIFCQLLKRVFLGLQKPPKHLNVASPSLHFPRRNKDQECPSGREPPNCGILSVKRIAFHLVWSLGTPIDAIFRVYLLLQIAMSLITCPQKRKIVFVISSLSAKAFAKSNLFLSFLSVYVSFWWMLIR